MIGRARRRDATPVRHAGALAALAATLLAALGARGQGLGPRAPAADIYLPDEGLLPPRKRETLVGLTSAIDDNQGELHYRLGAVGELAPWIPREEQAVRPALYLANQIGHWGDDRRGEITYEGGAKLRISLRPGEIVDPYAIVSLGGLYSIGDGGHAGLRVAQGLGIRIFQSISGEILADHLLALDGVFDASAGPQRIDHGASVLVGFDICSLGGFCDARPRKQRRDDRTCCAYDDARALCERTRDGGADPARHVHRRLCEAVDGALDASRYPPAIGEDSYHAFLRAITAELRVDPERGQPARPAEARASPDDGLLVAIEALRAHHLALSAWRDAGAHQERLAARKDRVVRVRRVYSPYPTDLRRALGCGEAPLTRGAPAPTCADVCDARPATSDACHIGPPVR